MKAEMDKDGVILIAPESGVEAYALKNWLGQNLVLQQDIVRGETAHWRSSGLIVNAQWDEPA